MREACLRLLMHSLICPSTCICFHVQSLIISVLYCAMSIRYRGAAWTAARNAPGSFALFGGAAVARNLMGMKEGEQPTWGQSFTSSCAGATASITVAAPFDVVKTRIQACAFDDPRSGTAIVRDLLRYEGPIAFFKGLGPKLAVVGPKLVFSFAVAQKMISALDDKIGQEKLS